MVGQYNKHLTDDSDSDRDIITACYRTGFLSEAAVIVRR